MSENGEKRAYPMNNNALPPGKSATGPTAAAAFGKTPLGDQPRKVINENKEKAV